MTGKENIPNPIFRRFKQYPSYKNSGFEWLGIIPTHWVIFPLRRRLFKEAGSIKIGPFGSQLKLEFMTNEGFKVYGQEHVIAHDFARGIKYVDKAKFEELAACEIVANDLVVTMMGSSGRCAVVPQGAERGIMDSHLLRIRLTGCELDSKYLCLLIDQSSYVKDQIEVAGKGAIMHGLNSSIIKSVLLAVPPPIEQQRILAFLNRETAKIDALIKKMERLIELLHEKRTAFITQAVTKGLDSKVPMKDSGIEWLGNIPAHWQLVRLRYVATLQRGFDLPSDEREDGEFPVISSAGKIGTHSCAMVDGPGVVIGRYGSVGGVFFVEEPFWPLNTSLFVLSFWGNNKRFVYWLLVCMSRMIKESESSKSAVPGVDRNDLHEICVALPSFAEQDQISGFLGIKTAQFNVLLARINRAIDRLKEYRTSLISAAVTGKIDVRVSSL